MQAVTGPNLEFYNVVARWPGSVHDSRIFDNSRARVLYEENRVPGVLLGDAGYACHPFLMTPLVNPGSANTPEGRQVIGIVLCMVTVTKLPCTVTGSK